MIARLIVSFVYFLDACKNYKKAKSVAYDILENPKSKIKPYFDAFIIFLVLITVSILIYDIAHELPYHFEFVENLAVSIFILEWLGRFWIHDDIRLDIIKYHERMINLGLKPSLVKMCKIYFFKKIKYIFSPMSIIDLLAILPTYRPLRILRIFLIFRLLKIFRYTKSLNIFFKVLSDKKFEFNFLFLIGIFTVFLSSTIMYVFEGIGNNPNITSFLDAVYWAIITITTVGYGDITPVTFTGKIVTLFLVGGGFLILVLATSIVTNALSDKIDIVRENQLLTQAHKLNHLIAIFGFGRMGKTLADELHKNKKKFIVVDKDEENILKAKELGFMYIKADASEYETINNVVFKNDVEKVVITTDSDALNLSILLTIKAEKKDIEVIVRANNDENIKKFKIAKADHVIFPYETVAEVAVEYIGNSVKFDAIENILLQNSSIILDEINILKGSNLIGKNMVDIGMKELNITTIAILKNGHSKNYIFNPDFYTYKFEEKDTLVVIGDEENIEKIKKRISRQFA
ncbi:NAD-binding protein [Sulfurospirillum arcachonense]|uniref:NAD-binding protein n=1 Tax=Sulfurospirillum arcachonense TaxID=57666 RepID=UPI0004686BBF|nr:NAD-binding protein [Sulfurospirillum arcachonense]